jgi:hypothetical protein
MAIEQLKCQDFSATVTNPGLIPVDTNANVQQYHRKIHPSTESPIAAREPESSCRPNLPSREPQLV